MRLRRDHLNHVLPVCYFSASSAEQKTTQRTLTTSGAAAPIASEAGTAATTGSIAVGQAGKYQEQGSIDISGSKGSGLGGAVGTISAGTGSNIVIGDPNASNVISQLAQQFASSVQDVAASGASGAAAAGQAAQAAAAAPGAVSYKTLGLIAAGVLAIAALFAMLKGKRA